MERRSRRSILKRGLLLVGGAVGLGAAKNVAAAPGRTRLDLYARNWRAYAPDRRPGSVPARGERLTARAELLDRGGRPAGTLYVASFVLHGPGEHPAPEDERLELHTLKLREGTIIGSGTAGGGGGVFAVVGGTGRYAGTRGTYTVRHSRHELGGDGTAELAFELHI